MIMSMYKTICITNRHLVTGDYNTQIKKALSRRPYALILREKDLTEKDYECVAKDVIKLCDEAGVKCILHTFDEVALRLGVKEIHMPLNKLLTMDDVNKKKFDVIKAVFIHEDNDISITNTRLAYIPETQYCVVNSSIISVC